MKPDDHAAGTPPSPLGLQIGRFLDARRRENVSEHTLRAYAADLRQFLEYISAQAEAPPRPESVDLLSLRAWMADLYRQNLSPTTLRRKVAALRSFFRFLVREGAAAVNVARLLATPKSPKTLPRVMTAEQTSNLLDATAAKSEPPSPPRDLAILELLYGSGVRVSELTGLNLGDVDFSDRWLRIRGKGRKERQVPFPSKAASALERYIAVREARPGEEAVFVNRSGQRLSDRSVRKIVKLYATLFAGDSSIHPHSFRHAYATHLLSDGANLRAIQELLGHARLSTTQKYTQLSLNEIMAIYDRSHPKA